MSKITNLIAKITLLAIASFGLMAIAPATANATGRYCTAPLPQPTTDVSVASYNHECIPIPEPTKTDETCTTDGYITIPHTYNKVLYKIKGGDFLKPGDNVLPAGKYIVEAYVYGGPRNVDKYWDLEIVAPDCEVHVTAPSLEQFDCSINSFAGELTLHPVDNATYTIDGDAVAPGTYSVEPGNYEVVVTPNEGYTLPEGDDGIYTITVNPVNGCPGEPGEPGAPGLPGAPGQPGAPGPVTIIQPQPARPIVASPTTTG